jgi:hypothetical protein
MIKIYFCSLKKAEFRLQNRWLFLRLLLLSFWTIVYPSATSVAQSDSVQLSSNEQGTVSSRDSLADVWDVYYRYINRKGHRRQEQYKPGLHTTIFPELAYALQTGVAIGLNANLSFTSANPDQNVSTIFRLRNTRNTNKLLSRLSLTSGQKETGTTSLPIGAITTTLLITLGWVTTRPAMRMTDLRIIICAFINRCCARLLRICRLALGTRSIITGISRM